MSMNEPGLSDGQLAEQVAGLFSRGVTLGAIRGHTREEYEAVYALGHSLYGNGRYLDAVKAFAFLVMNDPYERRFVKAYAHALQMARNYQDALTYYALASVMDLTDPVTPFHAAECLIALRQPDEARKALETVQALCTGSQQALKDRARALLELLGAPVVQKVES